MAKRADRDPQRLAGLPADPKPRQRKPRPTSLAEMQAEPPPPDGCRVSVLAALGGRVAIELPIQLLVTPLVARRMAVDLAAAADAAERAERAMAEIEAAAKEG